MKAAPLTYLPEGPQPLVRSISPGEPYPIEALGPLREVVEAIEGMTQAPVAIPAGSALAVAAVAVQGFADVETLGGTAASSLYILTIAQSGERKTTCDNLLMAKLLEYERDGLKEYCDERQAWENAKALWDGERSRILGGAKSKGKNADPQVELTDLGPPPPKPRHPDRVVTEPNLEGLTRLYAEGQPSLGLLSDEGGQFLGGTAMSRDNKQKTLAGLNKLWHGDPIRRTRGGDGHSTLFGRRLSIHLMVQPEVARAFLADPLAADTGNLARYLLAEPPSTIGTRFHAKTRQNPRALDAFGNRLLEILRTPLPVNSETGGVEPRVLSLSAQARELLIQFSDEIERQQAPGGSLSHIPSHASKAAEQAARLSAILTLWRDLEASEVSPAAMVAAIELAQFYLNEASRLASAANLSSEIAGAEKLRQWLLERWEHPDIILHEVVQSGPNALRELPKAQAALTTLERYGWVFPLDAGTVVRGKPRKAAWRIVRERDYVV